jgi:hypothetical protein
MLKKLILAAAIFTMGVNGTMAQTSIGKPTVPVYTKFSIGGENGRMIFDLVRRMNELDTTRDYRFAHMPGAGGEIALGRAVIDARAGKEVLIFESNPPFTFDIDNARGLDQATVDIYVIVQRLSDRAGQDKLDAYLAGSGSSSIKTAIEGDRTLGGTVDTLRVTGAESGTYTSQDNLFLSYRYRLTIWG